MVYRHGYEGESEVPFPSALEPYIRSPKVAEYTWTSAGDGLQRILDRLHIRKAIEPLCESPIEAHIGMALIEKFRDLKIPYEFAPKDELSEGPFVIRPQYNWSGFRMDFAILQGQQILLFVECDGAEFHHTEKQLANDAKKDARATEANIRLLRFKGTETYKDPWGCASIIIGAALDAWR